MVKMPLHPFYLDLILYNLYIRLFYTHFLPCVLIIISILCVSYNSIHVLNVYVLFRAISSPFFISVYKASL